MMYPLANLWTYWGAITQNLFLGVTMFLFAIAAFDYIYNFVSFETKLKMTKKEVKEEFKRREVDPHVKNRMRRMQRDLGSRRMVERTKSATVVVTNPTHFSVALKYEPGMAAPQVVAKGQDFLALEMREVAKELEIPIVENAPLARTLYKLVEVGHEIPDSLYKAVSEIIRYVFKLKGINFQKKAAT
jgi:flagellar biosynthesis protein FlhB